MDTSRLALMQNKGSNFNHVSGSLHMRSVLVAFCCSTLLTVLLRADQLPDDAYPGLRQGNNLLPSLTPFLGQEIKPDDLTPDVELIKRRNNFGYTDEEIEKYFSQPKAMTLDETGLNRDLIKPPPAQGVHPRILFNPEDLPAIRDRLANSETGKAVMGDIRAHITKMLTGDQAKYRADYDRLIAGDQTVPIFTEEDVPYTLMYEAFRCLVDQDEDNGKKVAAALTTIAQIDEKMLEENIAKEKAKGVKGSPNDWRIVGQSAVQEGTIGLDYDFAYNWMTDAQRSTVRGVLAESSAGMTNIGCETLHALHTGTANWISWSNRLIFVVSAIEGEPGYDPETYHRCEDAQTNYVSMLYPTGEAYEGWGKNFVFLEHTILMAKRGKNILASTAIRAAFNDYFIASLNPWGDSFTFCDSLGGSGNKIARNADVLMYHALFPKDVDGDFIYRNQVSGDYANIVPDGMVNTHHAFSVMDSLCCAIFATDFDPTTTWDKEFAQVASDRPLTYYGKDTCNVITRSAWDKDALYLNYLTRAIPGGHVYADRSHFSLYGLGRYWGIYHVMRQVREQYLPENRSVLLADGEGPSFAEGKMVVMSDKPMATFTATDLSITWDYQNKVLIKPPAGTQMGSLPYTLNDFRLDPSPIPWMSMPLGDLPNWYTSEKPMADDIERINWYKRPVQVVKAFRTAGLVRGPHPYTLIVDDLQKDSQSHSYDWGMILADDLTLGSAQLTEDTVHPQADIILNENLKPDPKSPTPPPANDRHLLVRVLQANQLDSQAPATVGFFSVPNPPLKNMQINKLHITSNCVSPDFKMLLFPYRDGQPLPKTSWSDNHLTLTVAWPDQSDQITFSPGADGRTRLKIVRGGNELINLL